MTRRAACCAGVAAAAAAMGIAVQLTAADVPHAHAAEAMEKFLARTAGAQQYRGSRRLEASGGGQRGWLEVETTFTTASGLRYDVTAEGGSGYIRSRVLHSLLDEEQRLIAAGRTAAVALSRENYEFEPADINGEGLAVVRLLPQRKDRSLITGHLFLSKGEGDLVRLEGTLARNPSFWVTRTTVARSYERVNGVVMPVALESRAQLRLFGSSTLRMTYHYSEIDNRPVGH